MVLGRCSGDTCVSVFGESLTLESVEEEIGEDGVSSDALVMLFPCKDSNPPLCDKHDDDEGVSLE